jgi:hypothetical protein
MAGYRVNAPVPFFCIPIVSNFAAVDETHKQGDDRRQSQLWSIVVDPWNCELSYHYMQIHNDRLKIDMLLACFFSAFDNRKGARPSFAKLTECFTERATIIRHSEAGADLLSLEEFAISRLELLTRGSLMEFHEWETESNTQIFGGIAVRISRYSKRGLLNNNEYSGLGTKCFQLVNLTFDWRIASLAWVDDPA